MIQLEFFSFSGINSTVFILKKEKLLKSYIVNLKLIFHYFRFLLFRFLDQSKNHSISVVSLLIDRVAFYRTLVRIEQFFFNSEKHTIR